ncbi:hypothetical protein [Leptolyngbya sp. FACHB-321]|uniref:hypothetical protein n=1 Tax=Leptolyngbya sp. FACHB-321 TaxID=2692807 RepID=UPI001A7E309F|nr:hypothetical protein [Leptolyngbya sp. FACHB-321]
MKKLHQAAHNSSKITSLRIHPDLLDPIEYRKSGLSLNHIVGCPLNCTYCVRHLFDNFEMKQPEALMSDEEAVEYLIKHPFFQAHKTPLQIFNRATDPFLPIVKPHTFSVLENLDQRGLRNHILVITRSKITEDDCKWLNSLSSLKVTLLITYSGIDDERIEPISSDIAETSLYQAYAHAVRYRVIFYWRPIIPSLNDSSKHIVKAIELSRNAHATVFTGLFYREQIRKYFQDNELPDLYNEVARRKILPKQLELRIIKAFENAFPKAGSLFRKTSCAVSYAHNLPDYNGHYGIRELCSICPKQQINRCAKFWKTPSFNEVEYLAKQMGSPHTPQIKGGAIEIDGLDEQRRYYIQHALGYQVHDPHYPHLLDQHGRAPIG